ncbi:rhodanese-like domain-containing protein [Chryseobacterium gotjawalense]|uniref:Rhodanese-like domain-containing protein n=1 Tax=Chryseobacterium gotjawalense TaxID=3042315 RepID=A0ABY8R9Y4_9FLAO|nr:rhodanese-like domain-containing protein [Chryseobacterium sp. wdc7]WHF50646.1 rhodanese-like domain-containing protein [Chryseobacterium sp. wdc7]
MSLRKIFIVAVISMISWSCKTAAPVSEVSRAEIKKMVTSSETTLVDVRIPEEFSEKTAEGAVNIPLATIEENLDFFRKRKQVVLFCNRGRQTEEAIKILKKNGITNVYSGKTVQNINAIKSEKK